jgi:hypothetical protein
MKYTKSLLEPLVAESLCVSDVMRKLGLKPTGGHHSYIGSLIKKFNLDTSHFLGQGAHAGQKSHNNKKHWSEVLVEGAKKREPPFRLRRAMLESGVEYKCVVCNNNGTWQNEPMTLEVEHKNGNCLDNRKDNLEFLCPNCHTVATQKMFHKGHTGLTKPIYQPKSPNGKCKDRLSQRKVERPPYGQLLKEIEEFGYVSVGKKYGVSDNAIRKWVKRYEISPNTAT